MTIVGVVDQARLYDIHQDGRPQMYIRTEDWGFRPLYFLVKTSRRPESLMSEVRAAIRRVDRASRWARCGRWRRSSRTC